MVANLFWVVLKQFRSVSFQFSIVITSNTVRKALEKVSKVILMFLSKMNSPPNIYIPSKEYIKINKKSKSNIYIKDEIDELIAIIIIFIN
jgi:hypothetical protein